MIRTLCILALLTPSLLFSQDFEGKIIFSVTYASQDSISKVPSHFKNQTITEYISDDRIRIDQSSSIGNQVSVYRANDSTYFILLNAEDSKIAITMSKEFAVSTGKKVPKIKYKWKSRNIAGFKCKLAIVTYPNEEPIEVYYTKEISPTVNQKFEGLKGYPLLFYFVIDNVIEYHSAVSLEVKELEDDLFEIPEGYKVMTLEEFQRGL